MGTLTRGLVAGAAGVTALNAVTYLDMAVRGRPASELPDRSVRKMAGTLRLDLGADKKAGNRVAGIGPLLGTATGVSVAVGYALLNRGRRPGQGAAAALTLGAMMAANVPMTVSGLTDPRTWTRADWLADIVPHAAYGATTALALRLMDR